MLRVSLLVALSFIADIAFAQQLNDPTAPPQRVQATTTTEPVTQLRLQAVQQRTDGAVAFINGQRVREGDVLAPYIITKITMNHVDVRHQQTGAEISLAMYSKALGSGGQD
ncbi:hypothetical protein [Pseudidiomarina sp. CB1]|uniref:hypothetical protein n=1 Tax=Pseudidiomarina sp. CB1 TaxID=2972484 RepID=UPI0021628073|nr:hypothetical protein [Pseudidiomarina sp. CB1]